MFGPLTLRKHAHETAGKQELRASEELIPYTIHADEYTLKTVEGNFVQGIRIGGYAFETEDQMMVNARKRARNQLLKAFSDSEFAVYAHTIRREKSVHAEGIQPAGFVHDLSEAWKAQLRKQRQFINELYLWVVIKQPEGKIRKAGQLIQALSHKADQSERNVAEKKMLRKLTDAVTQIMARLSMYDCERLGVVPNSGPAEGETYPALTGGRLSEPMAVLGYLLNIRERKYILPVQPVAQVLAASRPVFKGDYFILRNADASKQYCAIISVKEYDEWTAPFLTEEFLRLPFGLIMTQSFRFEDRQQTISQMEMQQGRLSGTGDKAIEQIEELSDAMSDAQSETSFGLHHFTVLVYADNPETLSNRCSQVLTKLGDVGITGWREDWNLQASLYAQLPGNFRFITRGARISAHNLASFVTFHNFPIGRASRNHWGDSVTVLQTSSGTPVHFNFHRADKGNTLILGPTGEGKTLTCSFLFSEASKFGGRDVYLDKDNGMEIFIRAKGGRYFNIIPGKKTGWAPLQVEDTKKNRDFLVTLFRAMLTVNDEKLSTSDIMQISAVVDRIFKMEPKNRVLRHVAPLFGIARDNNLRQRLNMWVVDEKTRREGELAWMFDNETDELDMSTPTIGFEMGHILDHPLARRAALMWIGHNIEQRIDGSPFRIFFDEGWKMIADDMMVQWIENFEFVIRKNNGIVVFATQAPETIMASPIAPALRQQSETLILFPNPKATRDMYIGFLGLSEKQYRLIKEGLLPGSRQFLVKNSVQAWVCTMDLSGMDDYIAVLSGNKTTVNLLHELLDEVGEDPEVWLPLFQERRKNLKKSV